MASFWSGLKAIRQYIASLGKEIRQRGGGFAGPEKAPAARSNPRRQAGILATDRPHRQRKNIDPTSNREKPIPMKMNV
jgi:hypothetical protein